MINHTRPLVLMAATALAVTALTACGGGSSSGNSAQKAAEAQLSSIQSAVAQASSAVANMTASDSSDPLDSSDGSSASDSVTTPDGDASKVDVCALLSPADAIAVARADQLDPAQTAKSVYTLTRTKEEGSQPNSSACRFDITDTAAEATVLFQVEIGSQIYLYNLGTKDPGLGDEAYTNENGGSVVRVGGLLITEGDDSFDSKTTLDLLSKMAPNLK